MTPEAFQRDGESLTEWLGHTRLLSLAQRQRENPQTDKAQCIEWMAGTERISFVPIFMGATRPGAAPALKECLRAFTWLNYSALVNTAIMCSCGRVNEQEELPLATVQPDHQAMRIPVVLSASGDSYLYVEKSRKKFFAG